MSDQKIPCHCGSPVAEWRSLDEHDTLRTYSCAECFYITSRSEGIVNRRCFQTEADGSLGIKEAGYSSGPVSDGGMDPRNIKEAAS